MTPECQIDLFLADPCVPYWAKDVARSAMARDPVDALNWLRALTRIFKDRADAVLASDDCLRRVRFPVLEAPPELDGGA